MVKTIILMITDPDTNEEVEYSVDLSTLNNKKIDEVYMKMKINLNLNYLIQTSN